jgi:hypothetical protein
MSESRLVTPEEAVQIGQEVREDFRAAVAKTERLASEKDALGRLQSRVSPPPVGASAVRAVRVVKTG